MKLLSINFEVQHVLSSTESLLRGIHFISLSGLSVQLPRNSIAIALRDVTRAFAADDCIDYGLPALQCQMRSWLFNIVSNAIPPTNTNTKSGSGTTRISASFACADSRRHGP